MINNLKNELEQKNIKLKNYEKLSNNQKILNNKLEQYETTNKKLEMINKEFKEKLQALKKEKEQLIQEKNNKELTTNIDAENNSFKENKINELEEEIESLKLKNNSEIKSKSDKIEELLEIIKNKDKQIEQIKKSDDSSKFLQHENNEEFEELKKKYENTLKDCENYKLINNKLLEEINDKNKNIDENEEYINLVEENNNLNKSLENIKDILSEKENEGEELKEKIVLLENQLKNNKEPKTERNPFKNGPGFSSEFEIQKGENRYSMGAKENRAEKYKKMVMDYENQIGNDLSQMNMLKSDIKALKNKLKDKEKDLREIKQLIQIGYKGINPSNKSQKEAVKKLQEYLNK